MGHSIILGPQYGRCHISFWHLEFGDGSYICGKFVGSQHQKNWIFSPFSMKCQALLTYCMLISGPLSLKQMWSKFNPAPTFLSIKKLCFRWWTQFLQTSSLFFPLALNWGSIYLNYGFHLHVTSFILCQWYSNYYATSSMLIDIMNTIRLHFIVNYSAGIYHRKCVIHRSMLIGYKISVFSMVWLNYTIFKSICHVHKVHISSVRFMAPNVRDLKLLVDSRSCVHSLSCVCTRILDNAVFYCAGKNLSTKIWP